MEVIPNILTEDECQCFLSGIWDSFEHISQTWDTPISRNSQESWKGFANLIPSHGMLYQHWGLGHSQAVWDIRQHPKLLNVFSTFWKCKPKDLIVSYDGLSFMPPPEITGRGWHRGRDWLHVDQSYKHIGLNTIQGFITLCDVNDEDATFYYLENSERYQEEFAKEFGVTNSAHWFQIKDPIHRQWYFDKGCTPKRVTCPKGSLILWDSRVVHCGLGPSKTRKSPNTRAIVYVCYKPRNTCSDRILEKRIKAFENLRMTTHDPCRCKLQGKLPQMYGNPVPEITPIPYPKLTPRLATLVGVSF
jgi:hypothetical protein